MEVVNFILGVQRINTKNYKRDILIKVAKEDKSFQSVKYVSLHETIELFNNIDFKLDNKIVRGLYQYIRGGENYDRRKQNDLADVVDFKQLNNADLKTFNIGYSIIFKKDSFLYKQPLLKNEDYDYFLMRIDFKSDEEFIEFSGSHMSNAFTGGDLNLEKEIIYSHLKDQTISIIKDTIYLYSLYDRIKLDLQDSEYNSYFNKDTIYNDRKY